MPDLIRTGGGRFDATDRHIYFIASGLGRLDMAEEVNDYILIAVNELEGANAETQLGDKLDRGKIVFLDSGIFNLSMTHARKHGVSMDQALAMPPDQIDGFQELYDRYIAIVTKHADRLWGYIELDQGGRENKIKTRARLEAQGLRPIPVYHPFNDGWAYFDYLAERYDRICFGNVVQADRETRKRLIATAWERRRKYPDLWIHLLGVTPNEWLNAYPIDSCDSSSWLANIRWADSWKEFACNKTYGTMPRNLRYRLGADADSPEGAGRAIKLSAYQYAMLMRNWRTYLARQRAAGFQTHTGEP
jgi:hypothetical protein